MSGQTHAKACTRLQKGTRSQHSHSSTIEKEKDMLLILDIIALMDARIVGKQQSAKELYKRLLSMTYCSVYISMYASQEHEC